MKWIVQIGRSAAWCLVIGTLVLGVLPPARSAGTVSLRFSNWQLVEVVWGRSLREAISIFESQNPGIRIIPEPISYVEKEPRYQAECAAQRMPDVVRLHNFSLTYFFETGCAADLTPFVQKEGRDFLKTWADLPIKTFTYKGRLMAMPGDYMPMVLIYNRELFKAAGLDPTKPPRTWSEFLDDAKRLTRATHGDSRIDQWGFSLPLAKNPGLPLRIAPIIWSFGADFLTPDSRHSGLNTPEFREAFKFIVELATVHGVMPPGVTTFGPQDVRTQVAQRRVAMKIGSGWSLSIIDAINPELHVPQVLEVAPVPVGRKHVTVYWLAGWIMSPHTQHPEEAWKFIKFLTGKETDKKFYQDNRVLSARKDVNTIPLVTTDKFSRALTAELPYGRLEPTIKEWPEIFDTFTTALQEAITGAKPMDRALADAHTQIEDILTRRR